jgi:uncharacterized CHY-type Zn-finger protein
MCASWSRCRHSYRWLRFPCCGRRYPCDLCHEELTDGHEMQWARRMVCGLCSTEQSVAPECKACGKKVATSACERGEGRSKLGVVIGLGPLRWRAKCVFSS